MEYKLILALLLINKGSPLNNSYKLTRILEWKFQIIDTKEIFDQIRKRHYVEYEIVEGVHYYTLTLTGKELIKREYDATLVLLLEKYPNEIEIIKTLFTSFEKTSI
jgi:hypothetical protein